MNKAVKVLKQAFPNVEVVYGFESYMKARRELILEGVNVPENTKGFVHEGKVYLDPFNVTKDTPFHEYAHIWLKELAIQNPVLFNKGFELLKGTEYMRIVNSIPYYQNLKRTNFQAFKEEVMANALGKRAADIFETNQEMSAWKKFVQKVTDWLKYKLNIASQSAYRDLTLDDFLDIGAKSIMTGDQTVFDALPAPLKESVAEKFVAPSISETEITEDDMIKGMDFVRRKIKVAPDGTKRPRNWRIDPAWIEMGREQARVIAEKRLAKEGKAAEAKAKIEPLDGALQDPTFAKVSKMFETAKKEEINSWKQSNGAAIKDVSDQRIARSLGKLFQDFESGDVSVAQFYAGVGYRAYPKRPKGMTKEEYKKTVYGIGALILETMIKNGVVDLDFSYKNFKADLKLARKKRKKGEKLQIPSDAGYVIVIKDKATTDKLANSVAVNQSGKPDYKEVYRDGTKPAVQE